MSNEQTNWEVQHVNIVKHIKSVGQKKTSLILEGLVRNLCNKNFENQKSVGRSNWSQESQEIPKSRGTLPSWTLCHVGYLCHHILMPHLSNLLLPLSNTE